MGEPKPILNCVSLSGGKDSTCMLLKMLEMGMQVDLVLFCDTTLEFPEVYSHLRKIEENTGIKITTIKDNDDFDYPIKATQEYMDRW